ncbi:MAG: hypothetical protein ABMB14_00260, partial [Myxococcota bacterium]
MTIGWILAVSAFARDQARAVPDAAGWRDVDLPAFGAPVGGAIDPTAPDRWVVVTADGAGWRTDDGGRRWVVVLAPIDAQAAVDAALDAAADDGDPSAALALRDGGGDPARVWFTDDGTVWTVSY